MSLFFIFGIEIINQLKMSKLNLKGNININDSESYQFLYASQCYQTLYSVYGKFNGAERIQEKGDDFLSIKSFRSLLSKLSRNYKYRIS